MKLYDPTPAEIAAECERIQADWTEAERQRRSRGILPHDKDPRPIAVFSPPARPWSTSDDEILLATPLREASAKLGRTRDACRVRLIRIRARVSGSMATMEGGAA